MLEFEVDAPVRLIEFLRRCLPEWKRSTLEQRLRAGAVQVNERRVSRNELLAAGDRVRVESVAQAAAQRPPPAGIAIVHEDEDLIAIDKPAGLLAVASPDERERTAHALLREYLSRGGGDVRLWPVHRIDRETSGVLLFAKSREAQQAVQSRWDAARKIYLALVEGAPRPASGGIDQPLWEDQALFVRVGDRPESKPARTHYKTLEARGPQTLLEVELDTGRRHQIRAHLAWLGHPIVGDARYGKPGPRLMLHGFHLFVEHPRDGRELALEAPAPKWAALR
ncbi:MAG: RluA family pseudouridine synthase [Planctomycetes bacterium]|nr:RluA family pseudouridine synthase [Planctomycetota bacterium]